jgi:hypothetical protein
MLPKHEHTLHCASYSLIPKNCKHKLRASCTWPDYVWSLGIVETHLVYRYPAQTWVGSLNVLHICVNYKSLSTDILYQNKQIRGRKAYKFAKFVIMSLFAPKFQHRLPAVVRGCPAKTIKIGYLLRMLPFLGMNDPFPITQFHFWPHCSP